jgi:transcriptional/translational regulatory protein YebC/TACO1
MELVMDAGADDLVRDGDTYEVICEPAAFAGVQSALSDKGIVTLEADIVQLADTLVKCDGDNARQVAKLLDALDDHDDVQNVFSNADLPDSAWD